KAADKLVTKYTASIPFDWRLYQHDIAGSIAHAKMLSRQGIIAPKEAESIISGLESIKAEIEQGKFQFKPELEDIHLNIEACLMDKVGEVGGKLHTARSRNDQVALDLRLWTKEAIAETLSKLRELQRALIDLAEANKEVAMPGYTHLQPAQPVLLAHHLLAYFEMLQRDIDRFGDCLKRTDVMPLGSGALAGVGYKVDREFLARELGFSEISQNSLDAVSDRDFVIEYEAAASLGMMHLSRLAEEIILWSSAEFNFIELDDAYATASSIMPQKKNPDVAELVRGKTGRVYGHLTAMLTTMKALPLAYNRDMQEDKEGLFDCVDTLLATLEVVAGIIKTIGVKKENMKQATQRGYLLATDLADYLVGKGEPFRSAHNIVGKLVSYAAQKGKALNELSLAEYKQFSPLFGEDVRSITTETSIAARDNIGGTAPKQVNKALARARKIVSGDS
ncbi:MAG TPA: argininosuccinate lyase, partial [Dehalococcoidales bacterium]|nr:argininosuccinate lyase [Dehalococcoidales bacterium]